MNLACLAVLAAAACSNDDAATGRKLFEACSLNSDCAAKLVCALGKCRNQCVSSVDCSGGTCVTDGKNAVCESAAEANKPCSRQVDCPAPLACASDYRCRNLCDSDADCDVFGVTDRVCAKDGQGVEFCADVSQVKFGAIATSPPPGAPGASVEEPVFDAAIDSGAVELPIGANGGTFGVDGITVSVPPGALDHDITISITPIDPPVPGALGQAFEIGPTGTHFSQPILITFAYSDAQLDGSAPTAYAVDTVVNGAWQPVSSPIVDPFTHTIAGTTTHLSPYALATSTGAFAGDSATGGDDSSTNTTQCQPQASLPLALKLTLPLQWPAVGGGFATAGNGNATVWVLAKLNGNATLSGTFQNCGVVLPDLRYNNNLPAPLGGAIESLSLPASKTTVFSAVGMQSGWAVGDTFSTTTATTLLGLSPTSQYAQQAAAWPQSCIQNCVPSGSFLQNDLLDDDGDNAPAVTANIGTGQNRVGPPTTAAGQSFADSLEMVFRDAFALSGMRVTDCSHVTGNASVTRFDTHVVGCQTQLAPCTSAEVSFVDSSRPTYQTPITGSFTGVQVSQQATCADVLKALP
jgi:hypothetical protein